MPIGLTEQLELINSFRKTAPVNVEGLAKALGISVRRPFLPEDVSGMIEKAGGDAGYMISVNAGDPLSRQRFTIAHELGHFMLHRHLLGDGIDEDRAYRSLPNGKYRNTRIGAAEETEANKFAANLLMPYELIERLKQTENLTSPPELAKRLVVSEQAMSIRLRNLD